jgi:hypothetical protein
MECSGKGTVVTDHEGTAGRFVLHGLGVELRSDVPGVQRAVARQLGEFAEDQWPLGFSGATGFLRPYQEREVLRHVSGTAQAVGSVGLGMEAFREGELAWIVDDRWGLAEINFMKGQWRSWLLPQTTEDAVHAVDAAVLWPLAQLLRPKGLHLVPAASVVRDGWSALILAPFGIEPELDALVRAGYRVIGQRWTALREEDGRVGLLHLPGVVEHGVWPRPAGAGRGRTEWVDLNEVYPGTCQNHAFCDAVVVVSSGRRPEAAVNGLSRWEAGEVIKRAWPIAELHPQKRGGTIASKLGQQCQCVEARLSPRGEDILGILDATRDGAVGHGTGRVTVFVRANQRRVAV